MSLVYRPKGGEWRVVKERNYSNESELQKMLYKSPELTPVHGGRETGRVFIREAVPPRFRQHGPLGRRHAREYLPRRV